MERFLILWAALLMALPSAAIDITMAWDGSPDANATNAIHYLLYWNTTANTNSVNSLNVGAATQGTITNAAAGLTYQIWVTASDTNNIESDPSNVVTFAVPDTFPSQAVLLSAQIVQTNRTWKIKVDWRPAPFEENVTGYKLDILTNGILSTNLFTTNTSAALTVPIVNPTAAVLTATNYYGWGKSNVVGNWHQPGTPRMEIVFLK
jgi:hypothetical protein